MAWPPEPAIRAAPSRRRRILPLFITGIVVALAVVLGRVMWNAYMVAPWTRDGTVRAYIVTMAPEVSGRIVGLPIAANQLVHKGDPLLVIDPTNYAIAVRLDEAAVQQAQANMRNAEREARRRAALSDFAVSAEQQQIYETQAITARAQYQEALAESGSGARQSAAHRDSLSGQRMGHQSAGAARRLCDRGAERGFPR